MKNSDQASLFGDRRSKKSAPPEIYPHQVEAIEQRVLQELALKRMGFGVKKEIAIACPCSFRPYAHILTDEFAQRRHAQGQPW